jgi:hypothetical protein
VTKYLDKTFSVSMPTSDQYRDNWNAIFAKKTLTKREIFDKVKAHLLAQMEKSQMSPGGSCAYRGPRGMKCAAGILIDDEHFDATYNTYNVDYPNVVAMLRASGVGEEHQDLIRSLQIIHDGWKPEAWAGELDSLEKAHFGAQS